MPQEKESLRSAEQAKEVLLSASPHSLQERLAEQSAWGRASPSQASGIGSIPQTPVSREKRTSDSNVGALDRESAPSGAQGFEEQRRKFMSPKIGEDIAFP